MQVLKKRIFLGMRLKWVMLFLMLFSGGQAFSQDSLPAQSLLGSWYLNFDYQISKTKAEHYETSSTAGFTSADFKQTYTQHNFLISIEKEIMPHWPVSISLFPVIGYGLVTNSYKQKDDYDIEEKLQGLSYGGGVSLNINTFTKSLRIQPFVSAMSLQAKDVFFLRYEDTESTDSSYEIETTQEYNVIAASIGVRFFNTKELISRFSITTYQYDDFETSVKASQYKTNFTLTKEPEFFRDNVRINLGMGLIF